MLFSQKLKKYFSVYLTVVALLISFGIGVAVGKASKIVARQPEIGWQIFDEVGQGRPETVDFKLFWEAWKKINQSFIGEEKNDITKRLYGAIKGMVDSLEDPYTVFMTPPENQEFTEELEGKFEGIGAEVGIRDGVLSVVAPLDGSPAQRAGIKAKDYILKINGEDTLNFSLVQAVSKIRGEKGTVVVLNILTSGDQSPRDVSIVRDTITVKSVKLEFEDDLAVITISQFAEDTIREFDAAVNKILLTKVKGVVVDLRNNPGGFLEAAIALTGEYVPSGQIVLIEEEADGSRHEIKSKGKARLKDIKTIVLVNGGSASASEIFTGALQDYKLAYVIGEKTFGKGSVQDLEELSNGSSLRVTIARWLTPNGRSINKTGLEPDEKVELTKEDADQSRDSQMDRAREYLLSGK